MTLHDLSTGWNGLFLVWGLVAAPIAVMSIRRGRLWALPFVAIQSLVALLITGAVAAFVVQPLLDWMLGPQRAIWWMFVVLPLGAFLFWLYANRNRAMPDAFKRGAIEVDNARMFGSIRSVTAVACAPLDYIQRQDTELFSVRDWVSSGRGVLFIPYQADQIAALDYVTALFEGLGVEGRAVTDLDAQALEHETPGGFNEQVRRGLTARGLYEELVVQLDDLHATRSAPRSEQP